MLALVGGPRGWRKMMGGTTEDDILSRKLDGDLVVAVHVAGGGGHSGRQGHRRHRTTP